MHALLAVFSIIFLGGSHCSGFLFNNNGAFKPFWERRTTARPAAQIMTTTTTTTKQPPTSGSGFFFSSSFSSSSGSSSSSSATSGSGGASSGSGFSLMGLFSGLFNHDICPMIKDLPVDTDVQVFKRQCYFAGSRCGRCGRGQMCCATNADGNCEMACVKGVSERRKEGACPAGTTHRATGGIGWVHAFCHWARATKAMTTPNSCRVDGDCEGSSKCCQSVPTPKDILGACERKCVAPAASDDAGAAATDSLVTDAAATVAAADAADADAAAAADAAPSPSSDVDEESNEM